MEIAAEFSAMDVPGKVHMLAELDFEYDDGYGTQELFGTIWYEDGSWSEREEYDGSECWAYKTSPAIPAKLIRKDKEREAKLNKLGI